MSGLAGDINAEPKPGTAIKIIAEEHHYLEDFLAILKRRLEMDEKHLNELRLLRDSWNPRWTGSGIWPLISPLIGYFTDEITQREVANKEIKSYLTPIHTAPPPSNHKQGDFNPLTIAERLEEVYNMYQDCHKNAKTPESMGELNAWKKEAIKQGTILPVRERAYRRAVVNQQRTVARARNWLSNKLPDILEQHQQCSEDIKMLSSRAANIYSRLHSSLSVSCSAALNSTAMFGSIRFISPRYDEVEQEILHPLLQNAQYYNYMLGGQLAQPLFGLGAHETAKLIRQLLGADPYTESFQRYLVEEYVSNAFKLEADAVTTEVPALMKNYEKWKMDNILWCAFRSTTPLILVSKEDVAQHRNGIPRAKLMALVQKLVPVGRSDILLLMVHLRERFTGVIGIGIDRWVAYLFAHNPAAEHIVRDIWRKWDDARDSPFPAGTWRVWNEELEASQVVSKKSGKVVYG